MGDNGLTMAVLPNRILMRHQEGPCNRKRKNKYHQGRQFVFKVSGNKKKNRIFKRLANNDNYFQI